MTSKSLMELNKAIKYMDPMQVTDYLQKTLDFLKRNNSEIYFPSISPYVEAFLVNLVMDTRNLNSKVFNNEDRTLADEIIEVLEMSREVFRWTHAYENGNLLVYKKIYSNKIKRKPIKLSAIADRLSQPHASDLRQPHKHKPSTPLRSPNLPTSRDPRNGMFTAGFKLHFLDRTLRFVRNGAETKLNYQEMPLGQAEYIYNLLKYRDKDVGFGYKSLYAQLWEAMEEVEVDYEFEVTLDESVSNDKAVLVLEKVPKSNKSKKVNGSPETKKNDKNKDVIKKSKESTGSPCKENEDCNKQIYKSLNNSFIDPKYNDSAADILPFGVLTNITDNFFKKTLKALTDYVDNENCKLKTFDQLSDEEIKFVMAVKKIAESERMRDMFMPKYRIMLWRLDRSVQEARKRYNLTANVDSVDRSITWRKTPKSSDAVAKAADNKPSALPPLELLANISETFFRETVTALADFAEDEACASRTFSKLARDQIVFVKRIRELAGSPKVRELFDPNYRELLSRLNYSINEAFKAYKITTTVNEKDGNITLNKKPKFATPAPVTRSAKTSVTKGARSKSMVAMKIRDRSISKDRLIQFEKGGQIPTTENVTQPAEEPRPGRGRSVSKRAAKLLEDLSTPVESDIGMRMMLLMGWDGGALGARGDGIIEPVMPKIELPTRGGLGHVPPQKVVPRKPIDFRLILLHNIHDFLLHDGITKQVQLQDPMVKKEKKFINYLITSVNGRHNIDLTKIENELLAKIYSRLLDYPGMELKADVSKDLRTITLEKLLDLPLRIPKTKIPKPATNPHQRALSPGIVDILITRADVNQVLPHIDVAQMDTPATPQAIKKRALRLLFLTKLVEALSYDGREQIVLKYEEGGIPKPIVTFIRTVVVHLNNSDRCLNLYGEEGRVYGDLLRLTRASLLHVQFTAASNIIFTRQPIIIEDNLPKKFAVPKVSEDNRNEIVNINDNTKTTDVHEKDTLKELSTTDSLEKDDSLKLNESRKKYLKNTENISINTNIQDNNSISKNDNFTETKNIGKLKLTTGNKTVDIDMDVNNNDDNLIDDYNENDVEMIAIMNINDGYEITGNHVNIETIENYKSKDMDIKIETDVSSSNLDQFTKTEETFEFKIEPHDIKPHNDKLHDVPMKIEEIKKEPTDFVEFNHHTTGLSDFDEDIQNLEIAILNSDADVSNRVKTENYSDDCSSTLHTVKSETDLAFIENDDSNMSGKRSHSNSICSQEIDPKKTKLSTENDENLVIITPNKDEKITKDIIKEIQTAMARELNKTGAFLPLLKCHGERNGGLVYSCHDDDDVAWLKKVISNANLDLEIVVNSDMSLENKSREMLIKINSYIALDTKNTFRKFEVYNSGLDTKFWKVKVKHETDTFVIFIVNVDEKSFKYISDENFCLYCGLDKAQFSVISK